VKLHELHVAERGPCSRRERQALAEAAKRIGALLKEPADSAGRNDGFVGRKQHRSARPDSENAANGIVLDDNPARFESLQNFDRRRRPRRGDKRAHQFASGAVAGRMDDARAAVRGFEPERKAPLVRPVEARAETS